MNALAAPALPSEAVAPAGASHVAGEFDPVSAHFLHRGHGAEFEMETDWVRAQMPPYAQRVVDVGCGAGGLFPTLGERRTIGVDFVAEGLAHTRERFPSVPLTCAGADCLPFADASLDTVALQHVIEHLAHVREALAEWLRILKPGGLLLLLTPNRRFCDPKVFDDPTHVRLFDRRDLTDVVTDAGFDVTDLRTLGLPWFRSYQRIPSGWRLRRFVTGRAYAISAIPLLRWKGQTLCCAARRPLT
ncbi:MAG: methyltransferase domain-containing protein [Planctomycetes bacterium]|nr:methyltransferase domain-containing protein [Planctomycetota bacterium]